MRNGNYRIIFRQLIVFDPTLLHRRKYHWCYWEQSPAMALDERSGGSANSNN